MYDLPWGTHRYFLEPLTGVPHISRTLARRYISFIDKIRNSSKVALTQLLETVKADVRFTTGFNLRYIMLLVGENNIDQLKAGCTDFEYQKIEESQEWRISFVQELVDIKNEDLEVPEFKRTELEEILEYICTT